MTVVIVVVAAGCASSRNTAISTSNPMIGQWNYTVDSPQGLVSGTLTFAEAEEGLTGEITSDAAGADSALVLDSVAFDSEVMQLAFSFDSGEFGVMEVTMTLEDDALSGTWTAVSFGLDMPVMAARKTE